MRTADTPRSARGQGSVWLAALSGISFFLSTGAVAVAYALDAENRVEDTLLGALVAVVAAIGLVGALAAFGSALVVAVRDREARRWLPLGVFPACVLFLALGEILWWE